MTSIGNYVIDDLCVLSYQVHNSIYFGEEIYNGEERALLKQSFMSIIAQWAMKARKVSPYTNAVHTRPTPSQGTFISTSKDKVIVLVH